MRYDAVLFDLDGTLLSTLEDIAASMNAALREGGYPTHATERYRAFVGNGAWALTERAMPEQAGLEQRRAVFARYGELYAVHQYDHTHPYPGVTELLSALARCSIPCCVLSNKPHESTVRCVRHCLPDCVFVRVQGQREGLPLKPAPDGALAMAAVLGLHPGRMIYVGDSDVDMHTARNAGMLPVGAAWGFRSARELREAGAGALLDHPMELLDILGGAV